MGRPILGDDPFGAPASPPEGEPAAKRPPRAKTPPPAARKANANAQKEPAPASEEPKTKTKTRAKATTTETAPPKAKAAAKPKQTSAARSMAKETSAARSKASAKTPLALREPLATHVPPASPGTGGPSPIEPRHAPSPIEPQHAPSSAEPSHYAPPPLPSETASEYGPSLDRPSTPALTARVAQALRRAEERLSALRRPSHEETERRTPALPFVWRRVRAVAMRRRSDVVDDYGRDPRTRAAFDPLLDFLYRTWFRVEVRGISRVPSTGRALLVGNHSGTLPYDAGMLMHAVALEHPAHRELRPLVENFVFHAPFLGPLVNRLGAVRACQENAARLLGEDRLVAVFPEGEKGIGKRFAERYQLQRFGRGGFIKLALQCDAPIVPTAILGAEEIHPMLAKVKLLAKAVGLPYLPVTPTFPWLGPLGLVPLPTKWVIAFGEPLDFRAQHGEHAADDRVLVNKLAEQVRQRIQEMVDELRGQRRSVLFG